ncbi:hypothetical protein OSTOST_12348, partial [Ostertagia ostertagi]
HSNKDACHRLRFTFDRIKKHLISTNDWKELGVIPLHFVIPVSKAYSGCNVEDEFRNFFENVDNNFNAFLDIISIGTNLRVKDPGVRVEIGSWDDIKTDVPSLTKHKDFKHVYKMDKMLQQYSSWWVYQSQEFDPMESPSSQNMFSRIRKALSGTLVNHVFRRTTRILTVQKDRHVEPKTKFTTESPRTTPVEAATQPGMKPVPQYKAGLMSGLLGKESPTESGEVDEEPLIDEERTHGIEAFYNKKSQGGGAGTSPNSSKHSDSKYKPYFIPLLILIIILALIIIFLLICIILMMKLEDRV